MPRRCGKFQNGPSRLVNSMPGTVLNRTGSDYTPLRTSIKIVCLISSWVLHKQKYKIVLGDIVSNNPTVAKWYERACRALSA